MTLFDIDMPAAAPRKPKPLAVAKWTDVKLVTRCHVCSANWQAGSTERVRTAKRKRVDPDGYVTLFCYEHAIKPHDFDVAIAKRLRANG